MSATTMTREDAAAIAQACTDGGVSEMTAALLSEGVTLAVARQRVDAVGTVSDMVALAGRRHPSITSQFGQELMAAGQTVDQVRSALLARMADETDAAPVFNLHLAGTRGGDPDEQDKVRMRSNMQALLREKGLTPKETT